MEDHAGSALSPLVKIINNTKEELTNLSLIYSGSSKGSIEISSLSANSEVITTISGTLSKSSMDLILKYSHNDILEEKVIYNNLLINNLIKITLEINEINGTHSATSIIEKDPVDNPIELAKTNEKKCGKCLLISGGIALGAIALYALKRTKK